MRFIESVRRGFKEGREEVRRKEKTSTEKGGSPREIILLYKGHALKKGEKSQKEIEG